MCHRATRTVAFSRALPDRDDDLAELCAPFKIAVCLDDLGEVEDAVNGGTEGAAAQTRVDEPLGAATPGQVEGEVEDFVDADVEREGVAVGHRQRRGLSTEEPEADERAVRGNHVGDVAKCWTVDTVEGEVDAAPVGAGGGRDFLDQVVFLGIDDVRGARVEQTLFLTGRAGGGNGNGAEVV